MRTNMSTDIRRQYDLLGIRPISGGSGESGEGGEAKVEDASAGESGGSTTQQSEASKAIEFTTDQHKEIDRIVAKNLREAKAKWGEEVAAAAAEAKAQEDKAREQDEAVKRGEFEKVKTGLETERDTAKTEADTLKDRVEQYEALAAKRVDALKDELKLPDEVMKRFPDDADSLVKLTWLEEQGELAKLYRTEGGGPKDGVKLPKTPDANGTVPEMTKEQQAAYDRQFVRSF